MLVVADSDSYVKYGAALTEQLPPHWRVRLVVAEGNAVPSPRQLDDAVAGTRFAGRRPPVVDLAGLREQLEGWSPDVVIGAARGYTVQATFSLVENTPSRPVLVSGIAGVAVPVLPYGLGFRRAVDVFVAHSNRELREFDQVARRIGIPLDFRLGTLPYLTDAPEPAPGGRRRIVFAAQALVPESRRDRAWLVERLAEAARAHPDLDVVVKVRALHGETQTHAEHVGFEELVRELDAAGERPANLLVEGGPMREHLRRAVGLVTVSSTAFLEAVAADVPVLALQDFGVGAAQINLVLRGSNLFGDTDDLVAARFRRPDPAWLEDNYFHDPSEDTWVDAVTTLLRARAAEGLAPYRQPPGSWMNRLRELLYREFAFGAGRTGLFAWCERQFLRGALTLNRARWRVIKAVSGRDTSPRRPLPDVSAEVESPAA